MRKKSKCDFIVLAVVWFAGSFSFSEDVAAIVVLASNVLESGFD